MALSLFRFIAAVGRTEVMANTLGTFILLIVFVLGGFIVSKNDLKSWMKWGYYVSQMMYGQNAIFMNEFLDERWSVVASERLSLVIEDVKMKELKSKINGELRKLTGLSTMDRHKASIKIGCDGDLTMQFFTFPDEEKEEWIELLLTMG